MTTSFDLILLLRLVYLCFALFAFVGAQGDGCYYCSRSTGQCIATSGGPCENPSVYRTLLDCSLDCVLVYQCNANYVRGKVCEPCTANKCKFTSYPDKTTCENQTSCGINSGFQCAKQGEEYRCALCDGAGCQPGMSIFESQSQCEQFSLCRTLSNEVSEATNMTRWQCSKSGLCAKCGGPGGDPECLSDRSIFDFSADCMSNTGCHKPAPVTKFQCIADEVCSMCREDLGECDPSLPTYGRAEECMQVTNCKVRESAYYAWQCGKENTDKACSPCRIEECEPGLRIYYSIEECVLHSSCEPAKQLPPKIVFQCRNNHICSKCRLDESQCNPDLRTFPTEQSCLQNSRCSFVQTEDFIEILDGCLGFRDIFPPVCARMAEEGGDYCERRTLRKTCAQSCCKEQQNKRQ